MTTDTRNAGERDFEAVVLELLFKFGLGHPMHHLTYEKWKDGIDITLPTSTVMAFAHAVRALPAPNTGEREKVLEEAAKAVEVLFYAPSPLGGDLILCADTLDAAAAAIRALKETIDK